MISPNRVEFAYNLIILTAILLSLIKQSLYSQVNYQQDLKPYEPKYSVALSVTRQTYISFYDNWWYTLP